MLPADQIGQQITCSDCLEEFQACEVGPDTPAPTASPARPDPAPDEEYALQEEEDESQWLKLEDDLTTGEASGVVAHKEVLTEDYEFLAVCPICGTRQWLSDGEIGGKRNCPDCFSTFSVRTPPANARRAKRPKVEDDPWSDEDFSLPKEPPAEEPSEARVRSIGELSDGGGRARG